jgi:hypothetical protein
VSDGDVGSVAILDDEQAGLVVTVIEHVGLVDALFGDHVAEWKGTIVWVLEGHIAVVAGIHLQGELVAWYLRT